MKLAKTEAKKFDSGKPPLSLISRTALEEEARGIGQRNRAVVGGHARCGEEQGVHDRRGSHRVFGRCRVHGHSVVA